VHFTLPKARKAAKTAANVSANVSAKPPREHPIDEETIRGLEANATNYGRWSAVFFVLSVVVGIGLLYVSFRLTGDYVADIRRAKDPELVLILLLARSTFFGALSLAFLYGLLTVATAYIDQSTRFRKRLYSAHMVNYAFETFGQEIKEKTITLKQIVAVFSAWNENVDSAFSNLRFQKKSKDLIVGGRDLQLAVKDSRKRE
jgi:phosphoglycerol transferase MdoB-like AlkP superfamily enzyme